VAALSPELFVGMTTWNSAMFLPISLAALRRCTDERSTRIVVLDNYSTDRTTRIAREFGAEVRQRQGSQSMALIDLFNLSRST
jgi:glycosyltransferase involved in cell wall biosynthesis